MPQLNPEHELVNKHIDNMRFAFGGVSRAAAAFVGHRIIFVATGGSEEQTGLVVEIDRNMEPVVLLVVVGEDDERKEIKRVKLRQILYYV